MTLRERLVNRFLGSVIEKKLAEARKYEAFTLDSRDAGFRRLTQQGDRDLSPLTYDRQTQIAYWLWLTNPLAGRVIEIIKDFVIGDGLTYSAVSDKVQEVLDNHWNDSINNWELKQENKITELCLYGEQVYPVFVNKHNGHVRLGYIDPLNIADVVQDQDNPEIVREIRVKGRPDPLKVINYDLDPHSETYGRLVGDCFYFAVNKVSNAKRGVSDLFRLADWIDGYDQFLFHCMERVVFLNYFLWDVTIKGASPDTVRKKRDELINNPPKPGAFRVHSEDEEWNAVAPDLKSEEIDRIARTLRNHVLGGAGIPEHWFAEGGDVNRATALEMCLPVLRKLRSRQKHFVSMVQYIFRFVLDQAVIAGTLSEKEDLTFSVNAPALSQKDVEQLSNSLVQLVNALTIATQNGWISNEKAAEVVAMVLKGTGVDIDAAEELEKVDKEAVKDYERAAGALSKLRRATA